MDKNSDLTFAHVQKTLLLFLRYLRQPTLLEIEGNGIAKITVAVVLAIGLICGLVFIREMTLND